MDAGNTQDRVVLNVTQTLAEIDSTGTMLQMTMDGEPPLRDHKLPFGRVVSLGSDMTTSDFETTASPDSRATMRVPSLGLDDDSLFELSAEVLVGQASVVILSSPRPLPRDVVRVVVRRAARALAEEGFEEAVDVADAIKDVALSVLRARIFKIEQSVRDALADEQLTSTDYTALRDYPARLALVEQLAGEIRDPEPTSASLRPSPGYAAVFETPKLDHFFKWAQEVEDEAKAAVARLSTLLSSQQVVIVQRQRLEVERFQRVVTLVGAAVLVPGLVAAVFGANFDFHGRASTTGFWAMLLLMVGGGVGSYALLRSIELGLWTSVFDRWPLRAQSERRQALILGAVALAFAAGGLLLLSQA